MAGFATLLGGVTAGLAGQNAQAGALAAQNEALNNSGDHPADAAKKGGVLSAFGNLLSAIGDQLASAGRGAVNMGTEFIGLMQSGAQQKMSESPSSLVAQGIANGVNAVAGTGGGRPPTAGPDAVTVVSGTGQATSATTLGTPPNALLSSSNNDSGSGKSDSQGVEGNATAPSSTYDTSITSAGSLYPNVRTDVTASQFQANLIANGYSVTNQGTSTNGGFTVLSNGTSTYTIYTRSSTGAAGVQYFGPGGPVKFSLGGH
ncbi:hypothetical protein [Trinickia caryophylli]|uniref:hypothetical protein n=1 Tax=Trinickia caryophylli TaxID=28094 RepID=UPI001E35C8B8|nr:hypothetical protein [Trinickia caryophylli]WQE11577.1 hypothetical protein U0034_17795 [Trinickia caryophylli]GLU34752.1 hypothetical protein Busp01_45940 [Trinickia caryophylli]